MKSLLYSFIIILALNYTVSAQSGYLGVGTNNPSTKIDVGGAATFREGAPITVTGTTVAILNLNGSQFRLTGSPAAAFTINGPTTSNGSINLVAGARMILVNATTQPGALNSYVISPGTAQEFTYSAGSWVAIRNPGTPLGIFAKSAGTQVITANQTISDWVSVTNNFGTAWNGSVFTVPAGMQGWYSISAGYSTAAAYGGGLRTPFQHVLIRVNGATTAQGSAMVSIIGGTVNGGAPGAGTANAAINYYLNAGDQVSFNGNHLSYLNSNNTSTAATSEPILTFMSILKL